MNRILIDQHKFTVATDKNSVFTIVRDDVIARVAATNRNIFGIVDVNSIATAGDGLSVGALSNFIGDNLNVLRFVNRKIRNLRPSHAVSISHSTDRRIRCIFQQNIDCIRLGRGAIVVIHSKRIGVDAGARQRIRIGAENANAECANVEIVRVATDHVALDGRIGRAIADFYAAAVIARRDGSAVHVTDVVVINIINLRRGARDQHAVQAVICDNIARLTRRR